MLIVPYGIETIVSLAMLLLLIVLIVPYGIETPIAIIGTLSLCRVLIVPYGIETLYRSILRALEQCVNCTLWN